MAQVTYNGVTCDIEGKYRLAHTTKKCTFSGNIIITSASSINAQVENLEDKLRRKNKDFSLSFNGSTVLEYSHSDNSGFLMNPILQKIPNELSTKRSRIYNFSVDVELPVDQDDYNYRRETTFKVDKRLNGQRFITFYCEYTAGGGSSAQENLELYFPAFIATILSAQGGTYEAIQDTFDQEQEGKILTATIQYKEIIYNQGLAGLDVAAIKDPSMHHTINYRHDVGSSITSPGVYSQPGAYVNVHYSCTLDKTVLGTNFNFDEYYTGILRPFVVSTIDEVLNLEAISESSIYRQYLIAEDKQFSPYDYTVSMSFNIYVPVAENPILAYNEDFRRDDTTNLN